MKTGLITPVTGIDSDIEKCKEHLCNEYAEFKNAWTNWDEQNGKTTAELVEELVDLATSCMTLADRVEKKVKIPALVDNTLLMVASKNYSRGYHNNPMI
ncbi:hypothetical protein SAMN02745671_01008 [Anaerovibrio lipolyticus DSM 3074]|uniref:Uncharacterized protein n=1 Tax=Anaerovibrio lipolyticus DSM 3074 TaxID=1120997 RepID=A0A1M6C5C0_9FIRM|nr:hypothetical protein [Anaerovibrio lipolyticus]SHI56209.1 hypothetical protein SAMN02745671_01008 [Anaerovibrio lipolyticus DSM 3074]